MRNHHRRTPSILREALLLVLAAGGLALLANAWRPDGLNLFTAPPAAGELPADALQIPLEEAARRHADASAVFVDARPAADFAAGRIRGALSGPEQEFDRWIEGFIAATEPETVIVAYCEGSRCELSKSLAEKLADLGYANARYLPDGWGRWKANGLPVEK
jgi:rhodanese-related sulfurtransferase